MVKQYSEWHEFQLTLESLQCRRSCLSQSSEAPFIAQGDIFNLASTVRSTVHEVNIWSQTNFKCLLLSISYKEFYMEDHLNPWWLHCRRLHFLEEDCCGFFSHSYTCESFPYEFQIILALTNRNAIQEVIRSLGWEKLINSTMKYQHGEIVVAYL